MDDKKFNELIRKSNDAVKMYNGITDSGEKLTEEQIITYCLAILEASGDVACAIYFSKRKGVWNDEVKEYCKAVLEAKGDVAYAIYASKLEGMWNDEVKEYCRAILESEGDVTLIVRHSKTIGFWKMSDEETEVTLNKRGLSLKE